MGRKEGFYGAMYTMCLFVYSTRSFCNSMCFLLLSSPRFDTIFKLSVSFPNHCNTSKR